MFITVMEMTLLVESRENIAPPAGPGVALTVWHLTFCDIQLTIECGHR